MGFFSGGSTTSTSDSYSGLRGTGQFKNLTKGLGSGFQTGMDFATNRLQNTNPFNLDSSTGLTAPQMAGFNKLAENLFSQFSGSGAARGMLSPENVGAIGGSALTQAAPQLLQQIFQNQAATEGAVGDRFAALRGLLDTGTGLAGSQTHATSTTKGPNLLGQAVSGWANPAQLGSFIKSVGEGAGGGAVCWIAEALFGKPDLRTHCARWYVMNILTQSFVGRLFYKWYLKNGERIAKRVPTSPLLRALFTPLFTHFANQGARYLLCAVR